MAKRRGNGEGSIFREGSYWVGKVTWSDERGTHRRRCKRKTQYEAREGLERLKREIGEGRVVTGDRAKMTVADVARSYLAEARDRVKPRTLRDYESIFDGHVIPAIGKIRAHAVRRMDIVTLLNGIKGERQRQYVYAITKAALGQYVRHLDPVEHPFPPRSTPKVRRREPLAMTLQQIQSFVRKVEGEPLGALLVLAISTGIRESELLGLRWKDVAVDHLSIKGKLDETTRKYDDSKTRRMRRVDVPASVLAVLRQHRAQAEKTGGRTGPNEYVFQNGARKPIGASNLRRSWRDVRNRLGLDPQVRLYDLRHAHATALLAAGVHPKIVQERLGHASIRLTMDTYSHVMPGMQREALRAVESLFQGTRRSPRKAGAQRLAGPKSGPMRSSTKTRTPPKA